MRQLISYRIRATTEKGAKKCQGKGRMTTHCRKPKKRADKQAFVRRVWKEHSYGKRVEALGKRQPTDGPFFNRLHWERQPRIPRTVRGEDYYS
jgi:hypothetical protein